METFASIPRAIPVAPFAFARGPNAIAEPLVANESLPNAKELMAEALALEPSAIASVSLLVIAPLPNAILLSPRALAFGPKASELLFVAQADKPIAKALSPAALA